MHVYSNSHLSRSMWAADRSKFCLTSTRKSASSLSNKTLKSAGVLVGAGEAAAAFFVALLDNIE